MNHCPYGENVVLCSVSCDSQPVSPLPPVTLPFSNIDYFLHLANFTPEHKNCPPWPRRDADANNTPMEMTNGVLSFQTSTGEAQFLQRSHLQHDGLPNMDLIFSPPQSGPLVKERMNVNTQHSTVEISKPLPITAPTTPATEPLNLPQKFKHHQKLLPSCLPTSVSSAISIKSSPPSRHAPPRKLKHRVIEKRYRTNLNEKFALLRDNIPSLRITDQKISNRETSMQGSEAKRNMKKVCQVIIIFRGLTKTDIIYLERQQSCRKQ